MQEWSALDTFRFPDPDDSAFYEGMEARFEGSDDKYVQTGIFMLLFERLHALRGFENVLTDLYLERERIENLACHSIRIIENTASQFPEQIHGFTFSGMFGWLS